MKLIDFLKKYKGVILIIIGLSIRALMLLYYYYSHSIDPERSWGDVGLNFRVNIYYPPLTTILLQFFIYLSFGKIEIFAFWAFFWEFITSVLFYFVLKRFNIRKIKMAYGLYLINPFIFLNNIFSPINCGYHITDSFFFFFFFLSLVFYPKKESTNKYAFFIFLGLSMIAKYYTLPAIGLLFIDFLHKRKWNDLKQFLITIPTIIILFMIIPLLFFPKYSEELIQWYNIGSNTPFFIRIIPAISIFILFLLFRIRKADMFEIITFSIIIMGSFMFFSYPYLRWFQGILFFGILSEKLFHEYKIKIKSLEFSIELDSHLLVFILSFFGVFFSFLMIIFILNPGFS